MFYNGKRVEVVQSDVHLGKYISTNITEIYIVGHVCDLYQRSNSVISVSLDNLHQTYSMHMNRCELWNLSCSYVNKYIVAYGVKQNHVYGDYRIPLKTIMPII